jgi:N-acetylglutamate synthase
MSADDALLRRTEIATVRGWKPIAQEDHGDWIFSANGGAIGRLNSVAILGRSPRSALELIAAAEAFFTAHSVAPQFRIILPLVPAETLMALNACGYRDAGETVLIMVRDARPIAAPNWRVTRAAQPDPPWRDVFEGDGFDDADSQRRAATYARSGGMVFFTSWQESAPAGAGLAATFEDMVGVHAMRTAPSKRGAGHASAILAAIAASTAPGATMFLHVAADNANAIALYRRVGFREIGSYAYWRRHG